MKQIDTIFFGNNGLTSTSANYIANKAKEYIKEIELRLSKLNFISEAVCLNNEELGTIIKIGNTKEELENIVKSDINKIGDIKSLIAWLREAIKAKEHNSIYISSIYTYNDFKKENNIIEQAPQRESIPSEEDIIFSWDTEKRKKYYDLEARCAVIGQLIHNNGPLVKAREDLIDVEKTPNIVDTSKEQIIVYKKTPTIDIEDLSNIIMSLQNQHRKLQSELNRMKHEIDIKINQMTNEINKKYNQELNEYNQSYKVNYSKYSEELVKKQNEILNSKIIIPESLKEIYEFINKL